MTIDVPVVSLVLLFVSLTFCNIGCIVCYKDFLRYKKRLSLLEELVDYLYKLRHLNMTEARLAKSSDELLEAFNKVINCEDS